MVQSPWEANWSAASQEIPRISRNPKVHYRTHKRPPNVSNLGQLNPVHIPTSHLLQIHPNIIHPSTPRSPQWSPSLRFPHQDRIHPLLLAHKRHMPSPSHSSRFYHPHNIGWAVQIIRMLLDIKCAFRFCLQLLCESFLILRRVQRGTIKCVHFVFTWSTRYSSQMLMKLEYSRQIFEKKNTPISNFVKIRSVGAELIQSHRQTDMTKLVTAFRTFLGRD